MAQSRTLFLFTVAALLSISTIGVFAGTTSNLLCEDLPADDCAFSVSSLGVRCVLEKYINQDGSVYQCQTSNIMAGKPEEWIESDECLSECGLERMSVGISSDGLLQRDFVSKLCSPGCQNNCPNVVDLYTNLAAEEGVYLAKVCNYVRPSAHRILADSVAFKNTDFLIETFSGSSTSSAAAPESSIAESLTLAPAPAPSN